MDPESQDTCACGRWERRAQARGRPWTTEAAIRVVGPQPAAAWGLQKLEDAGRTLPWSLQRIMTLGTPWVWTSGLQSVGEEVPFVLGPQGVVICCVSHRTLGDCGGKGVGC